MKTAVQSDVEAIKDLLKLRNKVCRLECVNHSSNKYYEIYIEAVNGKQIVVALYGAMNAKPQRMEYTEEQMGRMTPKEFANGLKYKKTKKGYKEV